MNELSASSSPPDAGGGTESRAVEGPGASSAAQAEAAARRVSAATTGWKIRRVVWAAVESTIFRYSFHTMYGWRAMLLRMFGAKIGPRCRIRRTVRVYYPWNLRMGSMCIVGDEAELYSLARITLADRVMISQEAYVCAGTHDYTDVSLPLVTRPIEIGPDAWVCARAFVGPGVKIGEGAVVAACGVVTKEVRSWMIVGGNPAREIKQRQLRSAAPVRGGPQLSGEAAD